MAPEAPSAQKSILLGRIHGAFGVRGEVKLESFTDPERGILRYQPWTLRRPDGTETLVEGARGRPAAKGLVVAIPGVDDRDAAEALRGAGLWVPRSALPPPKPGEYYWVDLEGLRVVNVEGVDFGVVSHLFSTGANDVLVARGGTPGNGRERMIPFLEPDYIRSVDFEAGVVTVDWDPEF